MKSIKIYNGTLEFDEAEHAYKYGDSFVPGVTSILKILYKPALIQWAANMACEYIRDNHLEYVLNPDEVLKDAKVAHRRIARAGADIGTEVHAFCEATLTDERVELPVEPKARKGAQAFLKWLHANEVQPMKGGIERMVFSKKWYYAGTTDFVGHINNEPCILDFKTSSGLFLEMLLQLSAYAIAIEEEVGMGRINTGWIIRLDKNTGKCEPFKIELKDRYRDAFLRVREAHELITKIEDEMDGLRQQKAA